eukprot:5544140-Prymnesium_polylepis.1
MAADLCAFRCSQSHSRVDGKCPAEPIPDAAFKMTADGACRKSADGIPAGGEQILAYRLVCNMNGSATLTYLYPVANTSKPE